MGRRRVDPTAIAADGFEFGPEKRCFSHGTPLASVSGMPIVIALVPLLTVVLIFAKTLSLQP